MKGRIGLRDQIVDAEFLVERCRRIEEWIPRNIELLPVSAYELATMRFDLVKLHYSLGTPLDEIAVMFRAVCEEVLETGADLGMPGSSYPIVGMLRLFGEDELRERLIPHLRPRSDQVWRRAHDFLMGHPVIDDDEHYPSSGGGGSHVRTWWLIQEAQADPVAAKATLEAFVRSYWIKTNSKQPWYGGHHDVKRNYAGYWCFEAAAIAQMFGIDDSALEGHKYYPYELAHYLG